MSFRVVLVSPMFAGNVGACARVLANFNVRDLWIVAPKCNWQGKEAQMYAKGPATAFLEKARECATLEEALRGCSSAVGFTRRTGELRRAQTTLEEIGELQMSATSSVALVFGREDAGLTREELLRCTHVCSFSTSDTMPSMNLSHALAVALHGLPRKKKTAKGEPDGASLEELEVLFTHWRQTMLDVGMTTGGNPERMLNHMRRALQRARLTSRDIGIFRGFLSKVQVKVGSKKRVKTTT